MIALTATAVTMIATLIVFSCFAYLFIINEQPKATPVNVDKKDISNNSHVMQSAAPATLKIEQAESKLTQTPKVAKTAPTKSASKSQIKIEFSESPEKNTIMRLSREDVLFYISTLSPHCNNIEVIRRKTLRYPDILLINKRVFALIFEKNRLLKFYLRSDTEHTKLIPGEFRERIVDKDDYSKEKIYEELDKAALISSSDFNPKLFPKLLKLLDKAAENDAFRKDTKFLQKIKEKNKWETLYYSKHGKLSAGVSRDELIKRTNIWENEGQTRKGPDPENPNKVVVLSMKKPYMKIYQTKKRLRLNVQVPYEFSVKLLQKHPLVYKTGKAGSWYTVIVDDTFKNCDGLFEIAEIAKTYTKELTAPKTKKAVRLK